MSRFLNMGVDGAVTWPRSDVEFEYGAFRIIAKPPDDANDASLHIDLDRYPLTDRGSASLFHQVLSLCVWIEDLPAKMLGGFSGNPVPVAVPRRRGPSSLSRFITDGWPYTLHPVPPEPARALAIYREAINLKHDGYVALSILNFYRILEIRYENGRERAHFLETAVAKTVRQLEERHQSDILAHLPRDALELSLFIRNQCRNAAAHAHSPDINPDNSESVGEMSRVLGVMRGVAEFFIQTEYGLTKSRWS